MLKVLDQKNGKWVKVGQGQRPARAASTSSSSKGTDASGRYRVRVHSARWDLMGQPSRAEGADLGDVGLDGLGGRPLVEHAAREPTPDEPEALPGLRQTVRASRAVSAKRKAAKAAAAEPAAVDPVARVLVDVPLAHLDRPFDYLVPEAMADDAVPGRPGQGAVRRPGGRRLPRRARRRVPTTPAG